MDRKNGKLIGALVFMVTFGIAGCEQEQAVEEKAPRKEAEPQSAQTGKPANFVQLVTTDYEIQGPDELPMGWHTFRLRNEGGQAHFVITYRLVEGKTIEDQKRAAAEPFDKVLEEMQSGELEKKDIGKRLGEMIEPWIFENVYTGGPGLVSPGRETQATVRFDTPGTYLMECYVKTPDGKWHTSMGMLREFTVTDEHGGVDEPRADAEVVLTNEGLTAPSTLSAGKHTIRVVMKDNPETFMPYDINLARIDDDTDLDELTFWMDWSNVGGLRAPAPVEFLGGVEHMPAGNHGYMTVDLEPGRYLWISEVNAGKMQSELVVR